MAHRAQLGRLGGSRWRWVLYLKFPCHHSLSRETRVCREACRNPAGSRNNAHDECETALVGGWRSSARWLGPWQFRIRILMLGLMARVAWRWGQGACAVNNGWTFDLLGKEFPPRACGLKYTSRQQAQAQEQHTHPCGKTYRPCRILLSESRTSCKQALSAAWCKQQSSTPGTAPCTSPRQPKPPFSTRQIGQSLSRVSVRRSCFACSRRQSSSRWRKPWRHLQPQHLAGLACSQISSRATRLGV